MDRSKHLKNIKEFFKDHQLIITKNDFITEYTIKKPNTITYLIRYTNIHSANSLLVTGDFGRWSFCRQFAPSIGGYVSSGYWIEKLVIGSDHSGMVFSREETDIYIKEQLKELLEDRKEYKPEGEDLVISKRYEEWLNACLGIEAYTTDAFNHMAHDLEEWQDDYMPEGGLAVEVIAPQLSMVFDGFDEMCRRYAGHNEIIRKHNDD